jgi:hypothetical protein
MAGERPLSQGADVMQQPDAVEKTGAEPPVSETETRVVALLNVAVSLDGTCEMCGQHDDGHMSNCPVPYLEEWLAAQYESAGG